MSKYTLRTTVPWSRFNHQINLEPQQWVVLNKHQQKFNGISYRDTLIDTDKHHKSDYFNPEFLKYSFVYVVTETVGEYPYPYFSEKTWKGILRRKPFFMINAANSLSQLKEYGFKTFDQWWDESYDQLTHVADRIVAVTTELKKLSDLSLEELAKLELEMQPILDHNYECLKRYRQQDLENIANSI